MPHFFMFEFFEMPHFSYFQNQIGFHDTPCMILSLFKAEKYCRFYTSMSLTRRAIIAIVLMSLVFLICYSLFAESDMISHRVVAVRSIIFENSEKMQLSEKP